MKNVLISVFDMTGTCIYGGSVGEPVIMAGKGKQQETKSERAAKPIKRQWPCP